jgi:hypothetical protein
MVDWAFLLFDKDVGLAQTGESKDRYTCKLKSGQEIAFVRDPASSIVSMESVDAMSARLLELANDASGRAARGDLGQMQWWEFSLRTRAWIDPAFATHMMRLLGQARAFSGLWRLGRDVVTEFSVEGQQPLPAAFAKQTIKVRFRSLGPGHGPFATKIARKQADLIRVILCFCLASPLDGGEMIIPLSNPDFPAGSEVNSTIPELTVRGIPIWSGIAEAAESGSRELTARMVNALTAFEHAMYQSTDSAATIFYVAAIEALTVPNHRYAHLRVTARFKASLLMLAEAKLVETLSHANFSEAFEGGKKRIDTAAKLADRIYALRSSPVHSGNVGLERRIMFALDSMDGPMRSALIADIAEAAILAFFACPNSSLVGHMDFDPVCRVELTTEEHEIVRSAAHAKGLGIQDYILQALNLPARD